MATGTANFPNRPFRLRIEVWYNWQSGRTASVHVEVWIDKLSYSPTYAGSGSSFEVYVDYVGLVQAWSGGYDFRNGNNFLIHASDRQVYTNIWGDCGAQVYANYNILGYAQTSAVHNGTDASVPGAPTNIGLDQITTTSMRYRFQGTTDGGSPITQWQYQAWGDPSFNGAGVAGSSGTTVLNNLTPGTTYYFRSRGVNEVGAGPWSGTISASTLPTVPPGMTLTPQASGTALVASLTPPGGATGVTNYRLEYRVLGSGTSPTVITQATSPITASGLTPGASYEFRSMAFIGTYESPYTAWTTVVMPSPNTNPGDFYKGSTTDTADLNYQWAGTAELSISTATAKAALGWRSFTNGDDVSGGTGAVYRATGAVQSDLGSFAARTVFFSDATAAGFRGGQDYFDIVYTTEADAGSTYYGSIHVKPINRSQRIAPEITWLRETSPGVLTVISTTVGTDILVSQGVATRLVMSAEAPALTTRAAVGWRDVSGTGWSTWKGGDIIDADGAMVSLGELFAYFDGSTIDTLDFTYEWEDLANQSTSVRRVANVVQVDPLADPDCFYVPPPPRPPTISSSCIEEIGVWRRYWFTIPATYVSDWLTVLPTLDITTGSLPARQVRLRVYANPFGYAAEQIDTDSYCSEQIISYIPANTILTLDGVTRRVWAEVPDGSTLSADHLLYGSGGTPATWPELSCGISHLVSLDVPLDSPAGNITTDLFVTQRY
jgi:hypothetical protein